MGTIIQMAFNFEKFEHVGGRFSAKASIRSNGAIGLSQGAILKFKLDAGEWYAHLYYDKEQKIIGIKPTEKNDEKGVTKIVTRAARGLGGKVSYSSFISAKSFLDYYGISVKGGSRSFPIEWNEEYKMLLIDLKKEDETES
jgi:hypothetical protein